MYNKTFIRWTTHRPEGLSIKDVIMAAFSDEQGKVNGEIEPIPDNLDDGFLTKGSAFVDDLTQN